MVDIFKNENININNEFKDIFQDLDLQPQSITEQNTNALNSGTDLTPEQVEWQEQDSSQWRKVAESRFSQEQIDSWNDNPIGFWEAKDFLEVNQVVPLGGLSQAYEAGELFQIGQKYQNGEELSQAEQKTFNNYIDKVTEMKLRGFSVGGMITYYGVQAPAFMAEFALSGGAGKVAQKAVTKGAAVVAEKAAVKGALAGTTKAIAGTTANIAARTMAMPSMVAKGIGERALSDTINVTDKGEVLLKQYDESPTKTILMAQAYTAAEVASEMSGAAIGKYVVQPTVAGAAKALKTPLVAGVNNLSPKLQQIIYKGYQKTRPNAKVSKVLSSVGWNGMLEEMGEEELNRVITAGIGLVAEEGYTLEDAQAEIQSSLDERLATAGIVSVFGATTASANIVANRLQEQGFTKQQADETVQMMTQEELDNKVLEDYPLPSSQYSETESKTVEEFSKLKETSDTDLTIQDDVSVSADVVNEQVKSINQLDPAPVLEQESLFNRVKTKWLEVADTLNKELFDDMAELSKISDVVGTKETKEAELIDIVRTRAGIASKINYNLEHETYRFDEQGNAQITGKSMKSILDDFDNTVLDIEGSRDVRQQDFNDYLVATRAIKDLDDRGIITEDQRIKSIADLTRLEDKYGDKFSWFNVYGQELYEYQQRILFNLVDAGVISQESYDTLLKNNPNYIPFQRVIEKDEAAYNDIINGRGKYTNASSEKAIKKIKGSEKDVKNVFESVIKNTAQIIDLAEKNKIAAQTANIAVGIGRGEEVQSFTKEGKPSKIQPKGTVVVFEEGQKKYYKLDDAITEALTRIDPVMYNMLEEIFAKPLRLSKQVLVAGATLTPEFIARNFARDQHIAFLQSKNQQPLNKGNVVFDTAKGISSILGKGDLYKEWVRSGARMSSYMDLDDRNLEKIYSELTRPQSKVGKYTRNPLRFLEDASMLIEQGTRVGEFARAKRAGKSDIKAGAEALDVTLNFARGGRTIKRLNRYVPFLNAGFQATNKMYRVFKENPKETLLWGTATVTLPSMIIQGYYLFAAPEEERNEYLEIPQWQKDLFWVFKTGDTWVRYPKPFAYGYVFGTVPERMMQFAYDTDNPQGKELWSEIVKGTLGSVSPVSDPSSLVPPAFKLAIENITNYNFFTGRNIYPTWMDKLRPEDRANKYTSETAKLLGKEFGVSPAKIDNVVRGQFGGAGMYALNAGDAILEQVKEWNGETTPEEPMTNADLPLLKAFVVRSPEGYRSVSAGQLFEDFEAISETNASYNKRKGKERSEYLKNNRELIMAYKPVKAYVDRMKAIQKQVNSVYDNTSLTSQQKVDRISKLEKQITKIARQGVEYVNKQIDRDKL